MKKRLFINLIASIVSFIVQLLISFLLNPYLVEKLGDASYGFIGLADNFVNYATILTVALNSMASRFISVEVNRNNIKKANEYYSSIFIADIILSVFVAIVSGFLIFQLQNIINIPSELNFDVKLTFMLVFINFMITILSTVFTVATFVKNRIDIASIRKVISNVLKVIVLLILFLNFQPKIYYIAIASIICSIYLLLTNIRITKKIASELRIKVKDFRMSAVKTIISSGIWNSINNFSRVLLIGLDLIIANLLIGPTEMGVLSISKTVPNAVESLLATIAGVFTPQFTILYSQGKKQELINEVKFSIKLLSLLMTVPLAGFIVFGESFYALWMPYKTNKEVFQLQILSILSVLPYILSAYIFTLSSLDTVTNKLKRPVIVSIIMSIATLITEIIIIQTTNLGIYAIAGVSSFYWILKVVIFNPINAAYNIKKKWTTFYPPFIKAILCMIIIMIFFGISNHFIAISTWNDLLLVALILGTIGYLINYVLLLNKDEKNKIISMIKNKIGVNKMEENKKVKMKKKIKNFVIIIIIIIIILLQFVYINKLKDKINILNTRIENLDKSENKDNKYAHFSMDDTIKIFKDLYRNENKYNSIFENDTLSYLKELHDTYGMVVSCYCWYEDNKFDLSMVPDKYRDEFKSNSNWLKFGFHAYDSNTKYTTDADTEKILEDYNKTVKELIRITGGNESIDNIIRLHYYAGTKENIDCIRDTSEGIKGLLTADEADRDSYYFDSNLSNYIYNTDRYVDNGLYFFNTDFRIENMKNVKEEIKLNENSSKSNTLIFFTHEWKLDNQSIKDHIKEFCEYITENNYVFDFPENRL